MRRLFLFFVLLLCLPICAQAQFALSEFSTPFRPTDPGQVYPQPPNVGLFANRPTFCSATGQTYYATDTLALYYSTVAGTSCTWTLVGGSSASPVSSVFGRTGAVVAQGGDYTCALVTNCATSQKAAPNQNLIYVSQNCGSQTNCYQAFFDVQYAYGYSCTNTSKTITTASTDPPFTANDVGKIMLGVNAAGVAANCPPQTTITAFNNAHSVTVNDAATATFTATGAQGIGMAWGHNDGTVLAAACAASIGVGAVQFPSGAAFFDTPPCLIPISSLEGPAAGLYGSTSTVFTPLSTFNFSSCDPSIHACFFDWGVGAGGGANVQPNQATLRDFTIYVPGWKVSGTPGAQTNWLFENRVISHNVEVWDNGSGIAVGVEFNATNAAYYPEVYGIGASLGCKFSGNGGTTAGINQINLIYGGYCSGSGTGGSITIDAGLNSYGTIFDSLVSGASMIVQGLWNSFGDQVYPNAVGVNVNSSHGHAFFNQSYIIGPAGNTFGALDCSASGGSIHLSGTTIDGGGSSGVSINSASGCNIFDHGGNTILNPNNSLSGNWFGSGSATGTTQTSGNIGLTSGWGSGAAASAVSGNSQREQFTITFGTTPGASPVVTVTFPTAFIVAPLCTLTDVGGTGALPTSIVNGAISTTSAAFTVNGTFVSGTEIFQLACSN